MADRLPDWVLLRYRIGELPPARMEAVRVQVEGDPELARRLEQMDHEEAALLERRPPRVVAAAVKPARRRAWPWVIAPVVALAGVLLVVGSWPRVRAKGGKAHLRIHHQVPGGVEELHSGDVIPAGAKLQLHYVSMGRPWGAIYSVDGRGELTMHLPRAGDQPAALVPEGTVALPTSYELDDAPGFERFTFVACPEPFDLEQVLDLVPPPSSCTVAHFELVKP